MAVAALRSLLFLIIYYSGSVILVLIALAQVPRGQAKVETAARRWGRWHRFCAHHILGITSHVEGALPQAQAIVALKHESHYETIELLILFDRPAVVMKKQLTDMPIWGLIAKAHGAIPVDRENGAAALRLMLRAAKSAVKAGRPVVIYPEGTRIAPGKSPALKPGIIGLYKVLNLPIVPVAVASGRLVPRGGFIRFPGIVKFKVGEAIPPGLERAEVEARLHHAINAFNR